MFLSCLPQKSDSTLSSKSTSRETTTQDVPPEPEKGRCSGVLKYIILVLFVPAFLNHAALYREAVGLKPQGEVTNTIRKVYFS